MVTCQDLFHYNILSYPNWISAPFGKVYTFVNHWVDVTINGNRHYLNKQPCAWPVQSLQVHIYLFFVLQQLHRRRWFACLKSLPKSAWCKAVKTLRLHKSSFVSLRTRLLPLHKWPATHAATLRTYFASSAPCFTSLSSDMCSLEYLRWFVKPYMRTFIGM